MTSIDIDINDLNTFEIKQVLTNYPKGHLEIKYDRVFWSVEMSDSQYNSSAPANQEQGYTQNKSPNDPFGRMGSTLMSMVSGK